MLSTFKFLDNAKILPLENSNTHDACIPVIKSNLKSTLHYCKENHTYSLDWSTVLHTTVQKIDVIGKMTHYCSKLLDSSSVNSTSKQITVIMLFVNNICNSMYKQIFVFCLLVFSSDPTFFLHVFKILILSTVQRYM